MQVHDIDINSLVKSLDETVSAKTPLTRCFYRILFQEHPEMKPLFHRMEQTSLEAHLMDSLIFSIHNLKNPDILQPALKELGGRHRDYDVLPEHYPVFPEAMIKALKESSPVWSESLEQHWRSAFKIMLNLMLLSYNQNADN